MKVQFNQMHIEMKVQLMRTTNLLLNMIRKLKQIYQNKGKYQCKFMIS